MQPTEVHDSHEHPAWQTGGIHKDTEQPRQRQEPVGIYAVAVEGERRHVAAVVEGISVSSVVGLPVRVDFDLVSVRLIGGRGCLLCCNMGFVCLGKWCPAPSLKWRWSAGAHTFMSSTFALAICQVCLSPLTVGSQSGCIHRLST